MYVRCVVCTVSVYADVPTSSPYVVEQTLNLVLSLCLNNKVTMFVCVLWWKYVCVCLCAVHVDVKQCACEYLKSTSVAALDHCLTPPLPSVRIDKQYKRMRLCVVRAVRVCVHACT